MSELSSMVKAYQQRLLELESKPDYYAVARSVFSLADVAICWLISPKKALENQPPITCDFDEVKELLLAIEHGVYCMMSLEDIQNLHP